MISEWYEARIIASVVGTKDIAELMAVLEGLKLSFEGLKAGIGRADYIRDFTLSLEEMTGSVQKAGEALDFFKQKAKGTRDDAMDLAEAFRDILPISSQRGFSQSATQEVTVLLSQLATMYDRTLDQMMQSYRRVLAGGRIVPGSNPLLNVLGISSDQIKEMAFPELIAKMQEVVDKGFGPFGQSAESTFKKVKLAWEDAFGEGFNLADPARLGFAGILESLTSDKITSEFKSAGQFVGTLFTDGFLAALSTTDLDKKLEQFALFYNERTGEQGTTSGSGGLWSNIWSSMKGQQPSPLANFNMKENGLLPWIVEALGGPTRPGDVDYFGPGKNFSDAMRGAKFGGSIFTTDSELSDYGTDKGGEDGKKKIEGVAQGLIRQAEAARQAREELARLKKAWEDYVTAAHGQFQYMDPATRGGRPTIGPYSPDENQDWALRGADMAWGQMQLSKKSIGYLGLMGVDPAIDAKTLAQAKAAADAFAKQLEDNHAFIRAFYNAEGSFVSALSSGFSKGWKGFLDSLGNDSSKLFESSANSLLDRLFGKPDSQGNLQGGILSPSTAKAFKVGVEGAEVFGGGFNAGMSGIPGSRTQGVLSGAVTGAATGAELASSTVVGAVWGAIIGAIVGAIGGALGAQQRQSEYMYAIPGVDAGGGAFVGMSKNITPNQLKQMQSQVQATFDAFYNGFASLVIKLGGVVPGLGGFAGGDIIQPNPSAHFMEHFQQFIQEGLPQKISDPFMPIVKQGFENLGLSGDKFMEIMTRLSKEDPKAALQSWLDLADALISFKKAGEIFGASGYVDFTGGAAPDVGNIGLVTGNVVQGPWAMKDKLAAQMRTSFLGDLNVNDDKINELKQSLNTLVGPQQLAAAKELGQLVMDKANAEKDAVKQLIQLANDTKQAFKDQATPYQVMGMVGPDGKPDNQAIANFFRQRAEQDLAEGRGATNPADIAAARSRFFSDVNSAAQAMQAMGLTPQVISKWALDALQVGSQAFGQRIDDVGKQLGDAGKKFWDDIQPTLDQFKTVLKDAGDPLGQFTQDVDGTHDPIVTLVNDLGVLSSAVQAAAAAFGSTSASGQIRGSRRAVA